MQNRTDMMKQSSMKYIFFCSSCSCVEQLISRYVSGNRETVKTIGLPCAGKIDIPYLVKAFETGAEAVVIVTCSHDKCLHIEGTTRAHKRAEAVDSLLEEVGLGKGRITVIELKNNGLEQALEGISNFFESARKLPQPQAT